MLPFNELHFSHSTPACLPCPFHFGLHPSFMAFSSTFAANELSHKFGYLAGKRQTHSRRALNSCQLLESILISSNRENLPQNSLPVLSATSRYTLPFFASTPVPCLSPHCLPKLEAKNIYTLKVTAADVDIVSRCRRAAPAPAPAVSASASGSVSVPAPAQTPPTVTGAG